MPRYRCYADIEADLREPVIRLRETAADDGARDVPHESVKAGLAGLKPVMADAPLAAVGITEKA